MENNWRPVVERDHLNYELYKEIYPDPLINNVLNDLKIDKKIARDEMEKAILISAGHYEIGKLHYLNYYRSPTERRKPINALLSAVKKLNKLQIENSDNSDAHFGTFDTFFEHHELYRNNHLINAFYRKREEGNFASSHGDFLEFLDYLTLSYENALSSVGEKATMKPTDALRRWTRVIRIHWKKHSPIAFSEASTNENEYSKAVSILEKIIQPLDASVRIDTLEYLVRETKSIS